MLKNFRKKTKNENFEKVSKSQKNQNGRPFGLFETLKGTLWRQKQFENSHSAEKIQRGPIVPSCFVSYV